ncbi:MAG: patatin-like phospholipase family protein [Candidatus Melainabacteria bacterium]|nr:patatin-like phospholipase family protein [Candidatus Melainabacteria bacterium]
MRLNKSDSVFVKMIHVFFALLFFVCVTAPPAMCNIDEEAEKIEKETVEAKKKKRAERKAAKEKAAQEKKDRKGGDDDAESADKDSADSDEFDDSLDKLNIEKPSEHDEATTTGQEKPKYKVALALGGGGGRGSGHIGVLKVLEEEKIPFDLVVGTSIGSIIGGMYCAGVPLKDIEQMFLDRSLMKAFMTVPLSVRMIAAPIMVLPRVVRHPYDGLYYGNKFRKYLSSKLPDDEKNIQDLKTPFAAVVVDLVTGKVASLTRGNLSYAMQASSAVPGLRKPVQIGDKLYVDGGVAENVPVVQCKKLGADVVIAVNIDEMMDPVDLDHFRKMGSVSKRLIKLQLQNLDQPLCEQACVTIHPDVTGIGLLSTSHEDAVKGIAAGEKAAREMMPVIKKRLKECGVDI